MADLACVYTLGAISFNNGIFGHGSNDDLYWIDAIHGLDSPTLRFTADDVPFGDGGLVHKTWKGPRHPVFEGRLIVQSAGLGACQSILDDMEEALTAQLEAMLAPTTATLSWTKANGNAFSLACVYEREVDYQPADNYRTRHFDFGLFAEAADLTET